MSHTLTRARATRPRFAWPALVASCVVPLACSGGDDAASTTVQVSTTPVATTAVPTTTVDPSSTSSSTTSSTVTTTSSSTTTTTTLPPIPRQPLTGVPLEGDAVPIDRPALAVKIDNHPSARRNHRGLGGADIVFEEIVEGSLTRFAAVFHSRGSDLVGPIRSGRSQDVDLLSSLRHPLFAWSGGNPGVERLIAESSLTDLNWQRGGRGYNRGPGSAPHNLYNDTATLWSQIPFGHPGAPPQQFDYVRPGEVVRGEPTAGLRLAMRKVDVDWTWNPERQRLQRSQEGAPHVDVLHGRIEADNVIVLVVEYKPSQIDTRSPEAQTLSESGPAWVFRGGLFERGRWVRTDPTQPFQLVTDDQQPMLLTPGTTWVELAEAIPTGDAPNPDVALTVLPPT